MNDDIVNLNSERERREVARDAIAIDGNEQEWQRARGRLIEVLKTSPLYPTALISAGLSALIEMLMQAQNLTLDEAKAEITARLKMFTE
jgi:hypothetical protein